MKILQITANAGYGGLPLHVLTLSKGLRERGHEVEILSMSAGPMLKLYEEALIRTTAVPSLGRRLPRDPRTIIRVVRYVRSYVEANQPNVIHAHGPRACFFCDLAQMGHKQPPLVASAHGSYTQFMFGNQSQFGWLKRKTKQLQYGAMDRATGRIAAKMVAVSQATRNDLVDKLHVPADKVVLIHNGIEEQAVDAERVAEIRRQLECKNGDKLVVYVGRIAFHKGLSYLMEAAKAVLVADPRVRFVLVGEGPMEEELRREAGAKPLAGRFQVMGRRTDALDYIAAADLFVLPSLSEGLPLTLLEAAMMGKAMVASDVGGVPEVVVDGETGLLIPAGDAGRLADAIGRLLSDDKLRSRMSAAARRLWLREFTADKMIVRTEELYQSLPDFPGTGGH